MRHVPLASIANVVAWAVVIALAAVSVVVVQRIGPVGLVLLGLLTLFVCTQFSLDEATPTWGTEVFRARMTPPGLPEQRAADAAERYATLSPLRFYRWCGVILAIVGISALVWQYLP